eukprot:m.109717 g.109717  ORF g.109717 m.109717 type:complete len:337 (+) comp27977_c4_seq2:261-1271(+)
MSAVQKGIAVAGGTVFGLYCLTRVLKHGTYTDDDCLDWTIAIHQLVNRNFASHLKLDINNQNATVIDATTIQITYDVPLSLCQSQPSSKDVFSLGFLLSIFDEISTYWVMVKDQGHRPGVSLTLSAKLIRKEPIHAGETLYIRSKIKKIGKVIAFIDCEVVDANGSLIAIASHTKYLPCGMVYENLGGLVTKRLFTFAASTRAAAKDLKEMPLSEMLPTHAAVQVEIDSKPSLELEFRVDSERCNPFGAGHGGYLATLLADLGDKAIAANNQGLELRELRVTYLSPAIKNSTCKAHATVQTIGHGPTTMCMTTVAKGHRVCCEAELTYHTIDRSKI